jgi:hypothetical protein
MTGKEKLAQLLKSRKFWSAIAALVIAIFGSRAGIDHDALNLAVGTLIAYILGTGLEDIRPNPGESSRGKTG